jgi:hypothetical protein
MDVFQSESRQPPRLLRHALAPHPLALPPPWDLPRPCPLSVAAWDACCFNLLVFFVSSPKSIMSVSGGFLFALAGVLCFVEEVNMLLEVEATFVDTS